VVVRGIPERLELRAKPDVKVLLVQMDCQEYKECRVRSVPVGL